MLSGSAPWFRGLWRYYLAYTRTPLHAASAAALAIFGLLAVLDELFVVLAVAVYVLPPVALYALEGEPRTEPSRSDERARPGDARGERAPERVAVSGDGDTDSDSDDGDTDTDSDDGDTDTDSDTD